MTTQEAFVDRVYQVQTEQNVQSDLWSSLSTFFIPGYNLSASRYLFCNGCIFSANEKAQFIYKEVKEVMAFFFFYS